MPSPDAVLEYTPEADIPVIVADTRAAFDREALHTVEKRKAAIRALVRLVTENDAALKEAVRADVGRCESETTIFETVSFLNEAYYMLDHIDGFAAPAGPAREGLNRITMDCSFYREPVGVVLVIATWNYPVLMVLSPLLAALSGGNTVVVKPSEVAPHSAALLTALLARYLPAAEGVVRVINGGPAETTAVLRERFDHIIYTGSAAVGKIVMRAAAEHLTPVTLELGGKSPTIIDQTCAGRMEQVMGRILWGKYVNSGQTCIAPDYLLVHSSQRDAVVAAFKAVRDRFMLCAPEDPTTPVRASVLDDPNYGCVVNERHFDRLVGLLPSGTVLVGGEHDRARLKLAPTLLNRCDLSAPLMQDEIFGPLLPLITYETEDEAITFIRSREKPLALYAFTSNKDFITKLERRTSSGVLLVNDVVIHVAMEGVPFGGVGYSGMGSYHGRFSYETFTHLKPVVRESFAMDSVKALVRYPPYSERQGTWYRRLQARTGESSGCHVM